MTNILFNLSGKIEKPIVAALYLLKRIADSLSIPFFVVGAFSRDLILKHGYGIEPEEELRTLIWEWKLATGNNSRY
jgi:hypothetical protein